MKKILIGLAVLVVIVAGGVYYLWTNLGELIRTAIESVGSDVTQVAVTLDRVDVDNLTEGTASLRGLTVGNPAGFKSDAAFKLGEITVTVDPSTITSDPVVIKEVIITKPEVTYEFGPTGSNIGTIQKNVDQRAGADKKPTEKSEDDGRKVIIENLYVRDGRVDVRGEFLQQARSAGTGLPSIHSKDIGKASGGATAAQVAEQLIDAIAKQATQAVSKLDISGIRDALSKDLGGAAQDMQKKILEGAGGTGSTIQEGAGEAEKKLKDLLGR